MNVMYLHHDPQTCAAMLCDQHLLAQIGEARLALEGKWKHNPVTKWAQSSRANWLWLWSFACECCLEYTRRFGRKHKVETPLLALSVSSIVDALPRGAFVPPSWHKGHPDYASYLAARHEEWERDGKRPAKWTKRTHTADTTQGEV